MRTITVEKIDGEYKVNTKANAGAKENTITFYAWQEQNKNSEGGPDNISHNLSRGYGSENVHEQGIIFFDFDVSPQTREDLIQSHVLYQGVVYDFSDYFERTAHNPITNLFNYEVANDGLIKFDYYWSKYNTPVQFARYALVDNIEYKISDFKASNTATVYGYDPSTGYVGQSNQRDHSEYYMFINADGSIATKDDFSNVNLIIRGGAIGGSQDVYYKGLKPELYASEMYEFTNINVEDTNDNGEEEIIISVKDSSDIEISSKATNVSVIQLMLQGYYGG